MPPVIQVTELHVTPNNCPLGALWTWTAAISTSAAQFDAFSGDPLTLDLTFCSNEPLTGMHWEVKL